MLLDYSVATEKRRKSGRARSRGACRGKGSNEEDRREMKIMERGRWRVDILYDYQGLGLRELILERIERLISTEHWNYFILFYYSIRVCMAFGEIVKN
jgi:hypothetical protein